MSQREVSTKRSRIPTDLLEDLDILEDLDLPGSGEIIEERREAVNACYQHLLESGTATKSEFQAEVYPDHPARYSTKGGWWNAIRPALASVVSDIDGVEPPAGEGAHTWRVTGDVQEESDDVDGETETETVRRIDLREETTNGSTGEDVEAERDGAERDSFDAEGSEEELPIGEARELALGELAALMAEGLSPSQALDYWATVEDDERETLGEYQQGELAEIRGVSQQAISDSVRNAKGELGES